MTVRDALPEDVSAIAALEERCFSMPWPAELIASHLTGPRDVLLCAGEGKAPEGYMGFSHVLDEGYITNVCVCPESRRCGIASALIAESVSRARELGLAFLTLEVRESNAAARALYEKHGFSDVGLRRGYYERPREDAVLMTLTLSEEQPAQLRDV